MAGLDFVEDLVLINTKSLEQIEPSSSSLDVGKGGHGLVGLGGNISIVGGGNIGTSGAISVGGVGTRGGVFGGDLD